MASLFLRTAKPAPAKGGQSSLGQGAAGFWEYEARRKAAKGEQPRNSAQDAEGLKQWEREQGIDPNQGSGHERRPPSSSKDAAQMEHDQYVSWLNEMFTNHPGNDPKSPSETVKGITEPVAEELTMRLLRESLKGAGPYGKALGKILGPLGLAIDIGSDPGDVW